MKLLREHLLNLFAARASGGVLQLTLGIGIVVSVICASMILIVYFSRLAFLHQQTGSDLQDNAASGIEYILSARNTMAFSTPEHIDLFGDETDSVLVVRKPWGVFEIVSARAHRGKHENIKTAMITAMPNAVGQSALYIPDQHNPLYLVGATKLVGTAYLSERKLTTGYIDGKDFEGKQLITGNIVKSESTMPPLDTTLLHAVKQIIQHAPSQYKLLPIETLGRQNVKNSISEVYHYFSNQSIDLTDTLRGNIIIQSAFKVRILRTARIADILVVAPVIEIEKGFTGSLQCFATQAIIVGTDCTLDYPSSLVLVGGAQDSTIVVGERSRVSGLCIIAGFDHSLPSRGSLVLQRDAVLHGMAYVNGTADIRGAIFGHITTRAFAAKIESAVYQDHLLDAEIDATKRSDFLPGSLLWAGTSELAIAKWLKD